MRSVIQALCRNALCDLGSVQKMRSVIQALCRNALCDSGSVQKCAL